MGDYPPCPPRCHHASPGSSPTLHDLSPATPAYSKCLPNSPAAAAPSGSMASIIQENPGRTAAAGHPSSPDHGSSPSLAPLHPQGSSPHLEGYHPVGYANSCSSASSSPVSQPSTPGGGGGESPFMQAYSPVQCQQQQQQAAGSTRAKGGSPGLLRGDDASPPAPAVTVKQEPQELDQMYLDDGESCSPLRGCRGQRGGRRPTDRPLDDE